MARNQHTFAKRQREMEKKRKAEEKRAKRRSKNKPTAEDDGEMPEDASQPVETNAGADESPPDAGGAAVGTPDRPISVRRQS